MSSRLQSLQRTEQEKHTRRSTSLSVVFDPRSSIPSKKHFMQFYLSVVHSIIMMCTCSIETGTNQGLDGKEISENVTDENIISQSVRGLCKLTIGTVWINVS